jgi:hypothetical protein
MGPGLRSMDRRRIPRGSANSEQEAKAEMIELIREAARPKQTILA